MSARAVFLLAAGAQLGRAPTSPYTDPPTGSKMSIGNPDIAIAVPDTCQLERTERPNVELRQKEPLGMSQTQLSDSACVRSKSETPRFALGSNAFAQTLPVSNPPLRSVVPSKFAPPPGLDVSSIDFENV